MRAKKLIEKLEDLATFLTLAQNDADKANKRATVDGNIPSARYWAGREESYGVAFRKVDGIIKEAKR